MVRTYVRRTNNNTYDVNVIISALKTLRETKKSIKEVAEAFNMKMSALGYHWRRHNRENIDIEENVLKKRHALRVFSNAMEAELLTYVIICAEVYSTVGSTWIRQLAYEYAIENKIAIPMNWKKHMMAGKDWYLKFKTRHFKTLAKLVPDPSCLEQIMGSHKNKGGFFHQNYRKALKEYQFKPRDVFILEQTEIKTPDAVEGKQDSTKSSSPKGKRLVTFIGTVSAIGESIPPFYIFSYTRYHNHQLLQEAPKGCKAKSDPTGTMTKKIFVDYLKHLSEFANCSVEKPVLLLVDHQQYHVSLGALKFAKNNGIVILTFPPRIRNKVELLELCMMNIKTEIDDKDNVKLEEEISIEEEKLNFPDWDLIEEMDDSFLMLFDMSYDIEDKYCQYL